VCARARACVRVCLKKALKTFCFCEILLQKGVPAALTTVRYVLKKTLSFCDGFLHLKQTKEGNMYENEQNSVARAFIKADRVDML